MNHLVNSCFRGIPVDNTVLLAVSGGSDSMALLLLANAWALKNNVHLQAVTVDHGLRPEAAAEAAFVASVCAGIGVDHVTLAWDGAKPSMGIQNAARQSRYILLDQFAHEIGADVILTGHTLDDQAETVYMRLQRGHGESDGRGLSGMARKTWLYGGTQIIRPLLNVSRATLRKTLNEFSQSWVEDPTNLDESYERVRVRRVLQSRPDLAVKYLALANISGRLRRVGAQDCARFLHANASLAPGPVLYLKTGDADAVCRHPVKLQAVQILTGLAGGQEFLTPRHKIAPLLRKLSRKQHGLKKQNPENRNTGKANRVSVGGAIIESTGAGLRFYREARNLRSLVLEPGETAIWDGRLHVFNGGASTLFIEALKRKQIKDFEQLREAPFDVKPRQALWSTPIIHRQVSEEKRIAAQGAILPLVEGSNVPRGLEVRLASPAIEHFCPDFDAPLRDWLMSLDQFSAASIVPKN